MSTLAPLPTVVDLFAELQALGRILAGLQPGEVVAVSAQHALADAVMVEFAR